MNLVIDMRHQRLFMAIEGKSIVLLKDVVREAEVTPPLPVESSRDWGGPRVAWDMHPHCTISCAAGNTNHELG